MERNTERRVVPLAATHENSALARRRKQLRIDGHGEYQ
jgi:hypothetical protein